ncbi:MAG: phosphate butyryltransferase [Clostridiales bacterium]|jgi:phosphate butyryltransferase|nr:phosphate butyryltransferase [Clostridiales bacterium]
MYLLRSLEDIVDAARRAKGERVLAVAAAEDASVIEAALSAKRNQIADAILVGDEKRIQQILETMNHSPSEFRIVDSDIGSSAERAVELVRSGRAIFLMKGRIETRDFLKPVVNRGSGLNIGRKMSHLAVLELPNYHKLIGNSDGGMILSPELEDKKQIIINATDAFRAMGYENPKIAVLAATETVNSKVVETVDAANLQEMNRKGEITDCIIVGPLSYDLAMSQEIARLKGVECPHCGDFDVLISPNMSAGNILSKCLTISSGAKMAGIIVGAKAPIVLSSRGSTAEEKYYSIALAALVAAGAEVLS